MREGGGVKMYGMDTLLDIIQICGAAALGLMGVRVTFKPPPPDDTRKKVRWFWGFAIACFLVASAQIWAGVRNRAANEESEKRLTGGDNFYYFEAVLDDPKSGGGYEWKLKYKEARPIPGVVMCWYEVVGEKEDFQDCWPRSTFIPHEINLTSAGESPLFPEKKYKFVFFGANSWEQTLEIYMDGNTPRQRGKVTRAGVPIKRIPNESR